MKTWLAFLVVACASCSLEVRTEGECVGHLEVRGQECQDGVCPASPDEMITALDVEGCDFVSWSGSCGPTRGCPAKDAGRATFARRAWPLRVDSSAAGPLSVQVLPSGADCSSSCDLLIPVGEHAEVVSAPASGFAPAFAGDCDTTTETRCSVLADRPRVVTVTAAATPQVHLRVEVDGLGSVRTPSATCREAAPCDLFVARSSTLSLEAMPDDPVATVVWVPAVCPPGPACMLTLAADLELRVVFSSPLTLSLVGLGPGSVRVNGADHQLPFRASLDAGQLVRIEAVPEVDDVVAGFDGLPCQSERVVETCEFVLDASMQGTISFQRFFQWARGGWSGEVTDVVVRSDGGVLMLGKYQNSGFGLPFSSALQSVVIALDEDAGVSRLSSSTYGFDSSNFLELPDGGLWLSGGIVSHRPPGPGLRVMWGPVDAGSTGSSLQTSDRALIEFDERRFEPIRATVWDFATVSQVTSVGRGPVLQGTEGLLTAFSVNGALDGGQEQLTTIAALDSDLTLRSDEAVASSVPVDLARYPFGIVSLSLHDPSAPAVGSCTVASPEAVPVLTYVNASGSCGASFPASDAGVGSYSVGTLSRDSAEPYFTSVSLHSLPLRGPGTQIATGFAHVHAHDASLRQRWITTLEPLIDVSPQQPITGIAPTEVMMWQGRVLALFTGQGTGVTGYRAANGLTVRCDPAADSRLLMTLHDPSTGELEWGFCFLQGPISGDLRVWFRDVRQNSLGRNRQASTVKAYGGVLLSSWADRSSANFPVSFFLGSHEVVLDNDSSYLGLVTPP
ncbi:MAG: hypothetical protein Q8L48_31830 [Archangium sp.]|nr:hypothetical protein [Archangium sp.]